MADYYTLPTEIGQAKLAAAQAGGPAVALAELAVGDGGGVVYDRSSCVADGTDKRSCTGIAQPTLHPSSESELGCG